MLNLDLALRQRRWQLRSQRDLAEVLGVSERTFARWERGEVEPSIERMTAWARALELKPADLLAEPEVAATPQ